MLYVQLDTNWPDHHKVIEAGIDGAGAHAIVLCLAKRLEKDGWVRCALLRRYGIDGELLERLVSLELLEADDGQVRPWDWHSRNPSQAAISARRVAKAEAGKRGNHSKHNHAGTFENCRICNPEPQVLAPCDRTVSRALAVDELCDRIPTKGEIEGEVGDELASASHPPPRNPLEARALQIALEAS